MAQPPMTTVEATGVLFGPRSDDPAELVDAAGRQPVIDLTRRLRPALSPIDQQKLTPFLGFWGQMRPDQMPEAFVVKVIAVPPGVATVPVQAARLLANEEEAARRNGLLFEGVPATGVGDGYAWVIRRYIHGLTLTQTRSSGGLAGNEVLLARMVLARIVELHTRTYNGNPLFHGDIKPANVIVRVEGTTISGVELIDYESGGATGDNGPAYRHATLQFASPEHFLSPQIDRASDVFSWGLTALDMYAPNRHPFVTAVNDPRAYEDAYGTGRSADEHLLAAVTDPTLRECIRLALTVRSDNRPSARALLDRLTPVAPPRPAAPVEAPTASFQLPVRGPAPLAGPGAPVAAEPYDPDQTAMRAYGLVAEPWTDGVAGHAADRYPGGGTSRSVDPGADRTRVAPTTALPMPLDVTTSLPGREPPPLPLVRPVRALPVDTADPDSVPAQLGGWWRQMVTARGYLGAQEFGPWHWAGYLVATVAAAAVVGMLVGIVLLSLGRLLFP
ncbi:Protein kinase domain-containing protein [Raineyella antarctica]|uniref:Protein kinase domain-containing protein n=1 Tax=Raineyella antarctica TaxID=1577474 RepID=A0A1G6H941_9ACTN|nr:hypothetical protein [Raineyella antarctica]SDB90618.1 Protein kinase domain-containing protein [Raineyella antarctica]